MCHQWRTVAGYCVFDVLVGGHSFSFSLWKGTFCISSSSFEERLGCLQTVLVVMGLFVEKRWSHGLF